MYDVMIVATFHWLLFAMWHANHWLVKSGNSVSPKKTHDVFLWMKWNISGLRTDSSYEFPVLKMESMQTYQIRCSCLENIATNFLRSCSLRLCISSVQFHLLTQSQSATVFCICTISFFCQHFKVLYLRHDLTDIDQTWSQVPVDHPIYVIWPDWGQRSHRGHRGQKGHFH